jgi:hypothetical protein
MSYPRSTSRLFKICPPKTPIADPVSGLPRNPKRNSRGNPQGTGYPGNPLGAVREPLRAQKNQRNQVTKEFPRNPHFPLSTAHYRTLPQCRILPHTAAQLHTAVLPYTAALLHISHSRTLPYCCTQPRAPLNTAPRTAKHYRACSAAQSRTLYHTLLHTAALSYTATYCVTAALLALYTAALSHHITQHCRTYTAVLPDSHTPLHALPHTAARTADRRPHTTTHCRAHCRTLRTTAL